MRNSHLLDDRAMAQFIAQGFTLIQSDQPASFHQQMCADLDQIHADEGNPGNNILPRLPQIGQVYDSPPVRGALTSLLGPGYSMHPHRYCHLNRPGSEGQGWHKDDYVFDQNVRHHRFRWVMAFYYPQDVTEDMGATAVMPGRQFHNTISSRDADQSTETELKLCGPAGTVALVNFDVWHRATANTSPNNRYMLKFQFLRMAEPVGPSWDNQTNEWPGVEADQHPLLSAEVWHWIRGADGSQTQPDGEPARLEDLDDEDEDRRLQAVYGLCDGQIPALLEALRRQARGLPEEQPPSSPANPQGSNPAELSAAYALAAVGPAAVGPLAEELEHADWRVRAAAADVLGNMGRAAGSAAPRLADCLADDNMWVRRNAAEALSNLAPDDEQTMARLVEALGDEEDRVRRNAALALAKIGPAAAPAVDGLVTLLDDENRYVRYNGALALQRIGTPEALQALCDNLSTARWCPLTTTQTPY